MGGTLQPERGIIMTTNQSVTTEEITIKTDLDEFQVEIAVARHENINNKKIVDDNIINMLIWLVETNPGIVDEFYSNTFPALSDVELEIQEEVVSLVKDKDWQGLFNLSDHEFIDF